MRFRGREHRNLLPKSFVLKDVENLEPYFKILVSRVTNKGKILEWLKEISEIEAMLSEELAWRYINTTLETDNLEFQESYKDFLEKIQPEVAKTMDIVHRKLIDHPEFEDLKRNGYHTYARGIATEIELYRKENLPIQAEIGQLCQEYQSIMANLAVEVNGKEYTVQEAKSFLNEANRDIRVEAFYQLNQTKYAVSKELHDLFSRLLVKRIKIALNAGFDSFLDYQFKALGRFDFSVEDCKTFHDSVQKHITPIVDELYKKRAETLGVSPLRPWDLNCDPNGKEALIPAKSVKQLVAKTITCLSKVDPYFGDCLVELDDAGHLDLESRMGKAPGGYNYPLFESRMPFIFMNAVGDHNDLVVLIHEAGHAVHSFLTNDQELTAFKAFPSEVAELASMSMELLTMDHWDVFYPDPKDLKRAKKAHLERIITLLPHIAAIDKFQHWIYEHPDAIIQERKAAWLSILDEFSSKEVVWFGIDKFKTDSWQSVLHVFELPLYFIEYGFAQLGAVAIWRNYKKDPESTLIQYKGALSMGSSAPVPEIYKAAGISFDFSGDYIKELASFLMDEYNKL